MDKESTIDIIVIAVANIAIDVVKINALSERKTGLNQTNEYESLMRSRNQNMNILKSALKDLTK